MLFLAGGKFAFVFQTHGAVAAGIELQSHTGEQAVFIQSGAAAAEVMALAGKALLAALVGIGIEHVLVADICINRNWHHASPEVQVRCY